MKHWLNQHLQAMSLVAKRMRENLLATTLMFVVMGVTLSLPGTLYIIVDNLNRLAANLQDDPQISLFLKLDIDNTTIEALADKLEAHPQIQSHRFASKDSAWEQLLQQADTAAVAVNLEKNPLPDAYFVTPNVMTPDELEILQSELQQWEGIEVAQLDTSWIKRLNALLQLGKKGILVLAALLGFALIVIIGNTVRLQILTQREEIQVSKLIGATDSFIRRPFLYAGTIYGLGGGLVACLLLVSIISLFNVSIADLSESYASDFRLDLPSVSTSMYVIASAILLSWIGSLIAVNRSLAQLDLN